MKSFTSCHTDSQESISDRKIDFEFLNHFKIVDESRNRKMPFAVDPVVEALSDDVVYQFFNCQKPVDINDQKISQLVDQTATAMIIIQLDRGGEQLHARILRLLADEINLEKSSEPLAKTRELLDFDETTIKTSIKDLIPFKTMMIDCLISRMMKNPIRATANEDNRQFTYSWNYAMTCLMVLKHGETVDIVSCHTAVNKVKEFKRLFTFIKTARSKCVCHHKQQSFVLGKSRVGEVLRQLKEASD